MRIYVLQKGIVSLVTLSNDHYYMVERKYFHDKHHSQKNMSVSSVYRVLKRFYQPMNLFKTTLPTVLHFDEFKTVRHVSGTMSFIILNYQKTI